MPHIWLIFNALLFHNIRNSHASPWCCLAPRNVTMIASLTGVFGSATAQDNSIPTSTQISYSLAWTCCLHNTPRGINRTWRTAIGDGNRLRRHCQGGLWEKNSLCGVRAPNKILHTEQNTTHFFFFDGDTIKTDKKNRHGLQDHGSQVLLTGTPETSYSHDQNKQLKQVQNNMHDWIRYILYTGAEEHENQPVQNRTTGCPLCRAAPRQMTGIQPCTPQLNSLCSTPSPKAHWGACWVVEKERGHLIQPQLHDRSSSYPVLWLTLKQWSTVNNSQTLRESDGHHGKTVCKYWLPTFSSAAITRVLERKSFSSIALAVATMKTS